MALLLCGVIFARSKSEPVVFVFDRVDRDHGVAYLRPMVAPELGVQFVSGPGKLERGAVLRCEQSTEMHPAIVNGQVSTVTELVLDCGEQKFVVKGLDFSRRTR